MNYIAEPQDSSEPEPVIVENSSKSDLFPCCLEVGELEDVDGGEKIATVQSLPYWSHYFDLRANFVLT